MNKHYTNTLNHRIRTRLIKTMERYFQALALCLKPNRKQYGLIKVKSNYRKW